MSQEQIESILTFHFWAFMQLSDLTREQQEERIADAAKQLLEAKS